MPVKTHGCECLSELMQAITSASRHTYWWQRTELITIFEYRRQRAIRTRPVRVIYGEATRTFYLGKNMLYEPDRTGGYQVANLVVLPFQWRKLLLRALRSL